MAVDSNPEQVSYERVQLLVERCHQQFNEDSKDTLLEVTLPGLHAAIRALYEANQQSDRIRPQDNKFWLDGGFPVVVTDDGRVLIFEFSNMVRLMNDQGIDDASLEQFVTTASPELLQRYAEEHPNPSQYIAESQKNKLTFS